MRLVSVIGLLCSLNLKLDELLAAKTMASGSVRFDEICMVDDVNGDGSEVVGYVQLNRIEIDDAGMVTVTPVGNFTNTTLQSPYTPANPVTLSDWNDALDIGSELVIGSIARRQVISGVTNWAIPVNTYVQSVSALTRVGQATVTDGVGTVSVLDTRESASWGSAQDMVAQPPTFTVDSDSELAVVWTEPATQ